MFRYEFKLLKYEFKLSKYEFKLSKYEFKLSKYEFKLSKYEFKLSNLSVFSRILSCVLPSLNKVKSINQSINQSMLGQMDITDK